MVVAAVDDVLVIGGDDYYGVCFDDDTWVTSDVCCDVGGDDSLVIGVVDVDGGCDAYSLVIGDDDGGV